MTKFDQMWYFLHICYYFATFVNPFFGAVLLVQSCVISRYNYLSKTNKCTQKVKNTHPFD